MDRTQGRTARRSAPRGTYPVGDERRARILDTAVDHFAQWGFHASSLARIAKDVGITQGGLLHHFRSKEDLLVSVLRHSDEQDSERFFSPDPRSAAEAFESLIELARYNSQRPGRTRMFNMLAAEAGEHGHPAHEYFIHRYRTIIDKNTETLRLAVERGELKPGIDYAGISAESIAVMDGLQLQWALAPDTFDMTGRLRTYLDRLMRQISADGSGLPGRT
ncbi:TetR/AcrR family transcriptional regulator [Streptomyces bobili]|uniref:TetR/AcrR family transcriptional regulator n=1 Tax=Streptomyces bobili TaxID=67280 RepID=UPI00364FE90D